MTRSYRVVAPNIGRGAADLIRAGGGGVSMKAPKAQNWVSSSMSDEGWELIGDLFGKNDAIRKKLEDTGLYPMDFLKTQNSAQLSALYQKHLEGAPDRAKAKAQAQMDIDEGEFLQRQEKLISEPMNWPGSLYDPSIGDQVAGEPGEVSDQVLDIPFGGDFSPSTWTQGQEADLLAHLSNPSLPYDHTLLPSNKGLDPGLFDWFGDEKLGEMKKHIERDEEGRMHGTSTEWRKDGSVKKSEEYNHGEKVSRIDYDKQGNITKTEGDPFKTKEEPAQKTTDALADLFQGLDPRVASKVVADYTRIKKELTPKEAEKVDPYVRSWHAFETSDDGKTKWRVTYSKEGKQLGEKIKMPPNVEWKAERIYKDGQPGHMHVDKDNPYNWDEDEDGNRKFIPLPEGAKFRAPSRAIKKNNPKFTAWLMNHKIHKNLLPWNKEDKKSAEKYTVSYLDWLTLSQKDSKKEKAALEFSRTATGLELLLGFVKQDTGGVNKGVSELDQEAIDRGIIVE
jgi:hypothetical protein